ncbi:NERD domain-containing protein [Ornithinibacillus xuwenensis]|uniref:NERD domain-containing protein n=1 Tax=Ornithinibacillus xuwenensis TaxID=3144668 RepID=A0ABU9XG65_9BACI
MITKQRGELVELLQLHALLNRLPDTHPKKGEVLIEYKKRRRQSRGEKEIEFPLSFLDENQYLILHDLRLKDEQGFFQIDTLIISEKFCLILEIKNWYGSILFGENGQVIRIGDDGREEGFPNPLPQAKLQQYRLKRWLNKSGIMNTPLDFFIVISFPTTILKAIPPYSIPEKVIHNNQLFPIIQELDKHYTNSIFSQQELSNISRKLIESHQQYEKSVLEKYNVLKCDILKGVICPGCGELPMIRHKQKWQCPHCKHTSIDAHEAALLDYKYLINHSITNQDARSFLYITSSHVTKRILQMSGYKQMGRNKGSIYML